MNDVKENDVQVINGVFRGRRQPILIEYAGLKVGDQVRLKIVAVPADHTAKIISLNCRKEFKVLLTSRETRDACGVWGPIWAEEMERVNNEP